SRRVPAALRAGQPAHTLTETPRSRSASERPRRSGLPGPAFSFPAGVIQRLELAPTIKEGAMRHARLILATLAIAVCAAPATAQTKGPCFFLQPNYQGDPMCVAPTQRLPTLGAVIKNKIMSVQVPSGMRVTICDADNFGGSCQTVRESVP